MSVIGNESMERLDVVIDFVMDELRKEIVANESNSFAKQLYLKLQDKLANIDSGKWIYILLLKGLYYFCKVFFVCSLALILL